MLAHQLIRLLLPRTQRHLENRFSLLPDLAITAFALEGTIADAIASNSVERFSKAFDKQLPASIRHIRESQQLVDRDLLESEGYSLEQLAYVAATVEAVEALPDSDRRLAFLCFRDGLEPTAVATLYNVSTDTVETVIRRVEHTARLRSRAWEAVYRFSSSKRPPKGRS